jgi:hypothetical protein
MTKSILKSDDNTIPSEGNVAVWFVGKTLETQIQHDVE